MVVVSCVLRTAKKFRLERLLASRSLQFDASDRGSFIAAMVVIVAVAVAISGVDWGS